MERLTEPSQFAKLISKYDTFLFDMDGVVWNGPAGQTLTPNVVQAFEMLRRKGKKISFVTNNATRDRQEYVDKFHRLGMVDVTLDEITSSGSATATYLKETVLPGISDPSKRGVFLIGQKSMELELEAAGISYTGGTDPANDVVLPPRDFSHIVPDPSIGVVCYSFDININYTKLAKAFNYLACNPGCQLVLTNDEHSLGGEHGSVLPGEGTIASPLLTARPDLKYVTIGKPHQPLLDIIRARMEFDRERTIMIGDRLETDIMWGKRAQLATMLVLSGNTPKAALPRLDELAMPTYVADYLGMILTAETAEKAPAVANGHA